ncbi:MAG: ABC transporter ATP-binding protein [Fuerstiella sp.]|nr:ABC transporter ATP-binding protein [Fuerstiella sp.]MCP4782235.1 ABC transporter ATP-binding protein [Fuerstiella sp.]MCP4858141.1 ABC transporter ATP-binding protein [Fuerstiella sp.]
MSIIATQQLTKAYGHRRGVDDVDLRVNTGEIFGFLGPNGAGKSTTIRLLLGFLKASSGTATVFGRDCWTQSASIKQDVGYVGGDVRLYPWLTARRAFQIVGEIRGMDVLADGMLLAERFRLEPDLPVRKMSRGNRQKVALVMALAHRPKLVILDEPTSGLDPLMQDTLADCLRELAAAGHTVFFSSHTLSEVESLCDRVAIVREGRIVVDESLEVLKARAPRTAVVTFESATIAGNIAVPDIVTVQSRSETKLHVQLTGSAVELTQWAASQPIVDLSIGKPNLEFLFRQYYNSDSVQPVRRSATNGSTEDSTNGADDCLITEAEES